jgi:curved DNA-binding protein CbpA
MYNWYGVLGIASRASSEEINAGFVRTAKQLHPDRTATPDPRLRLVLRAYHTLSDPVSRSTYDAALASRYAQVRQARRSKAVAFATTLALTLSCALAGALWREQGETLALALFTAPISKAMAATSRVAEEAALAAERASDISSQSRLLR